MSITNDRGRDRDLHLPPTLGWDCSLSPSCCFGPGLGLGPGLEPIISSPTTALGQGHSPLPPTASGWGWGRGQCRGCSSPPHLHCFQLGHPPLPHCHFGPGLGPGLLLHFPSPLLLWGRAAPHFPPRCFGYLPLSSHVWQLSIKMGACSHFRCHVIDQAN